MADRAKLFFQKQQLILPLWKLFFSSEKGSPSMWLQTRSRNVFSLLNGTGWKIFCLLLSSESPWGHSSQRAPAQSQRQSQKDISHLPTLPSAGQRRTYWSTCALAPGSARVRDEWGHAGLCMKKRAWIREPLTGSVSQGALSEPFGYAAPENEPGYGSCKRRLFVVRTKIPFILCKPYNASDGML